MTKQLDVKKYSRNNNNNI